MSDGPLTFDGAGGRTSARPFSTSSCTASLTSSILCQSICLVPYGTVCRNSCSPSSRRFSASLAGRSTARAAHLATIGKVLRAIDTLPFQLQQFGHYLYHPAMNMKHLLSAVLLVTAKAALPDLTSAKRVKAQYLVTLALQLYKGEVSGAVEWGPARVAAEMGNFFGVTIDPKKWTRDWLGLRESLKGVIKEVGIQAQQPLWQVIHSENIQ